MANRPKVFLDADVVFAGSAAFSTDSASPMIMLMAEITLLACLTSTQVITEVERNLVVKFSNALPEFRLLVKRCLKIALDPELSDLQPFAGQADPKDLPILVAALQQNCSHLLTFNTRHFNPGRDQIVIQRPGDFLRNIRSQLSTLSSAEEWHD